MISTPLVEGFDEVYKRNYTRLSQYAFHIIHDKGDAEDLANEAFLVYYQHADEMDIENPDAYLFKILRNLIGNYIVIIKTTTFQKCNNRILFKAVYPAPEIALERLQFYTYFFFIS